MTAQDSILPIEIRPGHFIRIHGIPHDLTSAEAAKIARVVMAMVEEAAPASQGVEHGG